MAKQSDLPSASTLGRASSSRIWRTVVFSGAMLGAPLIAAADTPPPKPADMKKAPEPAKPTPPTPVQEADTVESVMALIAEMDLKIKAATADAATAKLAAEEAVKKAKQVVIDEAAKVTALRKQKGDLDKRLRDAKAAEAKAKREEAAEAAKRPRATEMRRPKGRGFVLA